MGIKGLWSVLTPYSEKKSLHEIRGQTVAVDLAGWVCDSQNVTDYFIQPKLYLRNLFFRTAFLLLADITPIFVLDGDAPELKRDVMASRNALQFRGAAPRGESDKQKKKPDVGRKRFRGVLKECENLLKCMGVACVKGEGEAEATCAQLNALGIVDAVVSQDSDCFAYGARRVYRNFSVSNSAGGGAMQGSIDCYDARKLLDSNGFGRNKMVALALLCGCDYGVGACGSSITTVLAFLQTVSDCDIIPRLVSWVSEPDDYEKKARWLGVPGRCDKCGHAGKTHARKGCPVCVTNDGCHDTGHKAKVTELKRELVLRTKALNCGAPFPEPLVMKEFLNRRPPENIDMDDLKTCAPSLIRFVNLMSQKLDWSEKYSVVKFLPLLTKFHFQDSLPQRTLRPIRINKKRVPRGIPSYEVVWSDTGGQYDGLIPDQLFEEDEDRSSPWTTTERQDLMLEYYPQIVETFEDSKKKPAKEKKTRAKKSEQNNKPKRQYNKKVSKVANNISNLSNAVKDLSVNCSLNRSKLNVSVKVNKLKRKQKTSNKNQKTIDSFVKSKKKRLSKKAMSSLRCSFKNLTIEMESDEQFNNILSDDINKENVHGIKDTTHKEDKCLSILEISDDSINDSDLSDIVDNIVESAPKVKTTRLNNNFVKLIFQRNTPRKSGFRKSVLHEIGNKCSTPKGSPVRNRKVNKNSIVDSSSKVNTSYFFDKLTEHGDAFETSLSYKYNSHVNLISDKENTVNLSLTNDSLPDLCL